MKKSDQVGQYVRVSYIEPAAKKRETLIRIRAGDVHKGLHWNNRVPSVCQALSSRRFLEENNLELIGKQGPPSGLSTTTVFTYQLKSKAISPDARMRAFDALRGTGKEVFKSLGGGEEFLRRERADFYRPGTDPNDRSSDSE